jgi:glucosyltransferase
MDADLQHPPTLLPSMLNHIKEGYDVVTTKRINREDEPVIRSFFADKFYKIINSMSQTSIIQGAQDYRMMTRNVIESILTLKEYHRFSKGIFSWVGFDVKYIEIGKIQRAAGTTNWSFWSLFKYAIEGIIASTTVPLRFATILGILVSTTSFIYLIQIMG